MLGRDEDILSGIQALLRGSYVEHLERRGRDVPQWAWINLLAHGSEEALLRAARARRWRYLDLSVWRRARSYLAGEVVLAAHRVGSLQEIQARVLIPLELEYLSKLPQRRLRPGQWAASVLAAIERNEVSRRPSRG